MKKCSMQKKIESFKKSEKRTVTVSYDVYTYDELSPEAKKTARNEILDLRRDGASDIFQDICYENLNELFPNSDLKIEYSLIYCQGDGFNTYGTLKVDDLLNVDLSHYPLMNAGITPLPDKDAIKAACDKAEISEIKIPGHRDHYGYSLADYIELDYYPDGLSEEEIELLNKLEGFAKDVFGRINSQFEEDGYAELYELSNEDAADEADANGWEFNEDGKLV